jgi:carbon storage regulator
MLVLSRRENESIIIGHDVRITISKIKGNRVRLAIEAPRETLVHRAETSSRDRATIASTPTAVFVSVAECI